MPRFVSPKRHQGAQSLFFFRGMSFTATIRLLSTNWLLCACPEVKEATMVGAQTRSVGENRLPSGRSEPRENKRHRRVLKVKTVPRSIVDSALSKVP
ncbi:MAG: hypothetical protein EA381_09785 [Planctomycetaceae bacterium]|nr:MAG: hypothetical protein EA381_09785 [Planctomycetaceae bacterium]